MARETTKKITPLASYRYFDRVHVWLRKPLNKQQLRQIADHCERGWPEGVTPYYELCPFHPGHRMLLELYQPSRKAFEVLAKLTSTDGSPLVNYAEIVWDLIFNEQQEADDSVEYFMNHMVQGWHRKSMRVKAYYKWEEIDGVEYFRNYPVGWTTRTIRKGKRGRMGHWFTGYCTKPCKLTGETNCFHVEGRYSGLRSVQRIGIDDLSDLIDFDFNDYFDTHMKLYELDLERLGRFHRNQRSGSKSKQSRVQHYGKAGFSYNRDLRTGATLYEGYSMHRNSPYDPEYREQSLQHFLDTYGAKARRFLTPISPIEIHNHVHISRNTLVPATF